MQDEHLEKTETGQQLTPIAWLMLVGKQPTPQPPTRPP